MLVSITINILTDNWQITPSFKLFHRIALHTITEYDFCVISALTTTYTNIKRFPLLSLTAEDMLVFFQLSMVTYIICYYIILGCSNYPPAGKE